MGLDRHHTMVLISAARVAFAVVGAHEPLEGGAAAGCLLRRRRWRQASICAVELTNARIARLVVPVSGVFFQVSGTKPRRSSTWLA